MTRQHSTQPDPKLDLVLERTIDVPPALVWQAWTQPEHIKHWLTPAPWQTVRCDVDLRPGGRFRFVMRSPEGEEHTHDCCYLEIVEGSRLVWTNALLPGFRPAAAATYRPSPPSSASNPTTRARATRPPPCMARRPAAASTATWVSTTAGARRWTSWWRTPGICSRQAEYRPPQKKALRWRAFSWAARHYPAACANFFRAVMPPGVKYTELLPLVFSSQSDSCMYIKSEGRYPPPTTAR